LNAVARLFAHKSSGSITWESAEINGTLEMAVTEHYHHGGTDPAERVK